MIWIPCMVLVLIGLAKGRTITDPKETAPCFTSYTISATRQECFADSDCNTYTVCCQNQGEGYSVCVPYKGHVLPEKKSHQSLSDDQSSAIKNHGQVFHLPQPSPIPLPILDESTYHSKS